MQHLSTYYPIKYYRGDTMYEDKFAIRLSSLRAQKGVSARDMSLSIGQNPGYINNIETGKSLPSMASFFYICDYLNITPQEFFDMESDNPEELRILISYLKKLDCEQFKNIYGIVKSLSQNK